MTTGSVNKKIKLDKIDRKILNDLQMNGRMTNVELADRAGISAPPCLRRVRALEDSKVILGYNAHLNAPKLGFGVTAFASVKLNKQGETDLKDFGSQVTQWENVREAYLISGDFDFMLRVVAEDWEEYQTFLTEQLTTHPNVGSVRSSLTVKTVKYQPGVPISLD